MTDFCLSVPFLNTLISSPILTTKFIKIIKGKDAQKGRLKLTKKMLLTFLLSFIAISSIGLLFLFNPWNNSADAAWFNDNWSLRKRIDVTVTSSGSDIAQLDTLITVDTTGITANVQTNCEDLRFTDSTGNTLPFYIDSCNDNSSTNQIWVRAALVPKNTTTYTMYMYYGNPSVKPAIYPEMATLYGSLEGYWTMNESSWNGTSGEAKDSSVNANNGTATNGGTTTTGQYGNAGSFDGTDDGMSVGDLAITDGLTAATWAFWVRPTTLTTSDVIWSKANGAITEQNFYIATGPSSSTTLVLYIPATATDGSPAVIYCNNAAADATWSHIIFTYNGGGAAAEDRLKMYINGIPCSATYTGTANTSLTSGTTSVMKFGNTADDLAPYNGRIDDARIYSRTLSDADAQQLYASVGSIKTAATTISRPTTSFASEEKGTAPVAYWNFDEGQGQTSQDSTANNQDGTLGSTGSGDSNDPTWQTEDMCVSGKCLSFDGSNDYISVPHTAIINPTTAVTISTWVKFNNASDYHRIIDQPSEDFLLNLETNSGNSKTLRFVINGSPAIESNSGVPLNEWFHVAATYDGATMRMYINGVLQADTESYSSAINQNSGDIVIGRAPNTAYPMPGYLDEMKIYNIALTEAQVKANYNARNSIEGVSVLAGGTNKNDPGALSNGLAAYYKTDEAAGATNAIDSSGNANTGTYTNGATTTVGKFGNGASLDATDDYITVADSNSLDIANQLTVSAWIKADAADLGNYATIVSKRHSEGDPYNDWIIDTGPTGIIREFCITADAGGGPTSGQWCLSGGSLTTAWTHIVGTYDGTTQKIYIDGVLTASQDVSITLATSDQPLRIGSSNGTEEYFDGVIDETRVYNRALSQAEITHLYNWAPGPVGYWKMDDAAGTTAADSSGYGNNLTLTNGPYFVPGKYDKAVLTAGSNQHLTIADDTDFDFASTADTFSWGGWIKTPTVSAQQVIMSKYNEKGYKLYMESDGDMNCGIDDDASFGPDDSALSTAATYDDNRWHHVMCVKDATSLNLYIDGLLIATDASLTATGSFENSDPLYVGIDADGTSNDWVGFIDDMKIYNYPRSVLQVTEDMNGDHPAPGSPVGSPIGWWRFDERAENTCVGGTNDVCNSGSFGSAIDGTLTASSRTTAGKFGSAYAGAGGNTRPSVADNAALDFTASEDFTITAWIKSDATTNPTANNQWIVSKRTSATDVGYGLYVNSSGQFCFGIDDDASSFPEDSTCGTADIFDTAGTLWHHVVARKTGTSRLDVFVDGKPTGTPDTSISATGTLANSGAFIIADQDTDNNATANEEEFFGDIDEVKVFRAALTEDQIKLDVNQASAQVLGALSSSQTNPAAAASEYCLPGDATACTAPTHQYKFDEGVGTTAYDTGSALNNGTLGTGTSYTLGKISKGVATTGAANAAVTTAVELWAETGTFTAQAWIYPTSLATDAQIMGDDARTGTAFYASSSNGFTNALVYCFNATCTVGTNTGSSINNALTLNTWQHVAMTYNGSNTCVFYVNGVNVTSDGSCGEASAAYTIWMNGANASNGVMLMDNAIIYNYVRTGPQVAWDARKAGPIAHYRMDECQGTILNDSALAVPNNTLAGVWTGTGAGVTSVGTCSTSSTAWGNGVNGKRNSSLDFDGTDDIVTVTNTSQIDFDTALGLAAGSTFAAWIYVDSDGENDLGHIYSKDTNSPSQTYLRVGGESGGTVQLSASMDLATADGTIAGAAATTITTGAWHHVAVTHTDDADDEITLWINGVAKATSSNGNGVPTTTDTANLTIGNNTATDRTFDGRIDDFRVYNFELNATLMRVLYNEGMTRYGPATGAP